MSFSNDSLSQKEYLKKYLSGGDVKKKKKKVTGSTFKRSTIIDDDIDLKNMRPLDDDEVELYQIDEDAPQIAGIIDERPPEVKAQEHYSSKRWKVFGGEDGVNIVDNMDKHQSVSDKLSVMSKDFSKIEESAINVNSSKSRVINESDIDLSKTQSPKRKLKIEKSVSSDSDISLPRNGNLGKKPSSKQSSTNQKKYNESDKSLPVQKKHQSSHHDDSDFSPPRQRKHIESSHRDDSDLSPPRQKKHQSSHYDYSDIPPSRYKEKGSVKKTDSDLSPPRKDHTEKRERYQSDSDPSPQRKESIKKSPKFSDRSQREQNKISRHRNDSDNSPPRRETRKPQYKSDSDNSPPRKERKRSHNKKSYSSSDASPPRRRNKRTNLKKYDYVKHVSNKRFRRESSSETSSSPRRIETKRSLMPEDSKRKRSSRSNTPIKSSSLKLPLRAVKSNNNSSPRLSRRDLMNEKNIRRRFSDSDDSPPRRRSNSFRPDRSDFDSSLARQTSSKSDKPMKKTLYKPNDRSSSDETSRSKSKKMKTTLDGKQAGLQDAKQLKKELSDLKMKEDVMFSKMEASISGVGAAPIKRDRKTGQIRDIEKEKEAQKEKDAKASVVNEKYYKWGKGIKQMDDAAERAAEVMKEMNKPLARYINDTDLDNFLKAQEREGDPMLDYIKKKQSEATPLTGVKPIYKGSYNPNRFRIRPGYRWDGVVRSNGYEKEWFKHQNARKARDEEAYKWSTSDM